MTTPTSAATADRSTSTARVVATKLTSLTELRRSLALVAAGLFVFALTVPVWRIVITAPQYPGQPLPVELYAYPHLGGEWKEVQSLNHYAGFYYPDPVYVDPNYEVHEKAIEVPEWVLGPVLFVGLAAWTTATALLPNRWIERGLTALFASTVAAFVAMGSIIQYRLHQAGHSLDPDAPLMGIEPFTPPLLGPYEVANLSGTAWLGPGGYAAVAAVVLLGVAFVLRDDGDATITDLPSLTLATGRRLRTVPQGLRERLGRTQSVDRRDEPASDDVDDTRRSGESP